MFMLYTGEDFTYVAAYPQDFAPMGLDREIKRIDTVLNFPGLNEVLAQKLQEKLARLLFADDDVETLDEIIKSIREEKEPVAPEDNSFGETGMQGITGIQ